MRALLACATLALLASALAPAASAGTLGDELERACEFFAPGSPACALARAASDGLERPGVSYGNFLGDPVAEVEAANFYFAPRVAVVADGQSVVWTNVNAAGGNRHSVESSDWGGASPVLPVTPLDFGGGAGFKSRELQPGDAFAMTMDLARLPAAAQVDLRDGYSLVAFHCYIHGAGQMNGELLVKHKA